MRDRSAPGAALAVVVLVVGQLAAAAHAAATRHVICEAHGEQIDAIVLEGAVDRCDQVHFIGIAGKTGEHEDCAIVRVLRPSTPAPHSAAIIAIATVAGIAPRLLPSHVIAAPDLVLLAPKTSPPA